MPKRLGLVLCLFALTAAGVCPAADADCDKRFAEVSEFRLLSALPDYPSLAATGKATPRFEAALASWSTDLVIKIVLGMEQEYLGANCPARPGLSAALGSLKRAYLAKLGIATRSLKDPTIDRLFRSFLVLKDDVEALRKKIAKKGMPKRAADLPKAVYGSASDLDGVAVVGASAEAARGLKGFVESVCHGRELCPFWSSLVLYKCIVSPEAGLAAFLPEMAVLVVSEKLLTERNGLHDLVLLHELAHVGERGAWVRSRRDWRKEFESLSGWTETKDGKLAAKVEELKVTRDDEIARLSRGSPFSILPDPVILGTGGKDGFVLARSYRESVARGDASEDVADHVAALFVAPGRYCLEKKPIAPHKWKWVVDSAYDGKLPPRAAETKLPCTPGGA